MYATSSGSFFPQFDPNTPVDPQSLQNSQPNQPQQQAQVPAPARTVSSSKRAEQNRKAQRAFRERRDQKVKELEQRAQLVETALASAEEANRRYQECLIIIEQLRAENAALRASLQLNLVQQQQQQQQQGTRTSSPPPTLAPTEMNNGATAEGKKDSGESGETGGVDE